LKLIIFSEFVFSR